MGFLTTLFMIVVPGGGLATYMALRLGPELPIACRRLGHKIGSYQIPLCKCYKFIFIRNGIKLFQGDSQANGSSV